MSANQQLVRDFLRALETRTPPDELERSYHPEVEQIEYPNAVTKVTAVRGLADLKAGTERGSKLLVKEEQEVKGLHVAGEVVILEAIWRGTLAIPVGNIPAGGQMVAHYAQFFEFKDGKIFRQRNYDYFQPFA